MLATNSALAHATNGAGFSVAEIATATDHADCLKLLLDHGVRATSATSLGGRTLLHVAATWNGTNAAALLLRRGAKVEAVDRGGFTPLHAAARGGATEVAALLLKHRANPDARVVAATPPQPLPPGVTRVTSPFLGDTALHLAAQNGPTNLISLLLRAGAFVNATNSLGSTPLDLAAAWPPADPYFLRPGFNRPWNPFGPFESAQQTVSEPFMGRQKAVARLLENAGGKHGLSRQPGLGPSWFQPR